MLKIMAWFWRIVGMLLVVVGLSLIWMTTTTWISFQALRQHNLETSAQAAQLAKPVLFAWSTITFHQVPDLEVWRLSINILAQLPQTLAEISGALDHTMAETTQPTVKESIATLIDQSTQITRLIPRTWLIKQLLPSTQLEQVASLASFLPTVQKTMLTGDQTWVLLFQNGQELRPTGGFMGSLAFITLHDGSLTKIEVQDIYQPDGQFGGFIDPPAGVKEYLSEGKGWRLPDMNWNPDFPLSAQQITTFLAATGHSGISGIITLNLETAEKILSVTGEVFLPDSQTHVDASNFASVLRQNRDQFFPGSVEKQHTMASFFTQLKSKLLSLDSASKVKLLPIIISAARVKQIQVYATNPELETAFQTQHIAGQLPDPSKADFYFFPIEANVGINKANQNVERKWYLTIEETTAKATINFFNTNIHPTAVATPSAQADHLHYVNYQRILVKPETKITTITFNDQPVTAITEETITTSQGDTLKQLGFLITIPEQTTNRLVIQMEHPPLTTQSSIVLGKQSGIAPIKIELNALRNWRILTLTNDLNLKSSP